MADIRPSHRLRAQLRVLEWSTAGGVAGAYASELARTQSLHAYVTHSLATSQRYVLSAETLAATGHHVLALSFELDVARTRSRAGVELPGARPTGSTRLPASAQLKFAAFVESATETGLPCRVDVGVASFLLTDALEAAAHGTPLVRHIYQRTGDAPVAKGLLQLTHVELVRVSGSVASIKDDFAAPNDDEWFPADAGAEATRARYSRLQARVDAWIESSLTSTYTRVLKTRLCEALKNAHCPLFTRDVGRVHAGAYLLHVPVDAAAADVYRAALRAAARCADTSIEYVAATIRAQLRTRDRLLRGTARALEVLANALTVATHALVVYENDFVIDPEHPGAGATVSEDFKEAEFEDGDDCEDSAKLNYVLSRLASVRFDRPTTAADDAWLAFQRALFAERWYKFGLVLPAIVTNKQADVRAIVDPNEVQAHTYAVGLPYARLDTMLVGGGDAGAEAAVAAVRATEEMRSARITAAPFHAELPVLVLEGTAPANALPLPATAYYDDDARRAALAAIVRARNDARAALVAAGVPAAIQMDASQSALEYTRAMADGAEDVSTFYKLVCSVALDFSAAGVLQFAASTANADGTLSHGVNWAEFVRAGPTTRARLVPEYALDARAGAVIDDFLEQLEPVPALVRTLDRAARVEAAGVPPTLLAGLRTIFGAERVLVGDAAKAVLADVDVMPLPAALVPLRARARDLADEVAVRALLKTLERERARFTHVRVATTYVADAPVPGETQLRDVVEHEILLYVRVTTT